MGHFRKFPPPKFPPKRRRARRPGGGGGSAFGRWLARVRPFGLLAGLAWLWATNTGMVEPVGLIATAPERVDARFTRCGRGRGHACVIDGDTFKLGDRKIRIIGIDAPETHPARCPAEVALGEAATARLQALLSEGPFDMVGSRADMTDRYGRELRMIMRDGRSIGARMVEEGVVRRYLGYKMGWC